MSAVGCDDTAEDMAKTLVTYKRHLQRRHLSPTTIQRYLTDLRAFARWLAGAAVASATADDIERFLDQRRLAARARYRWISELHRYYSWAVAHNVATQDPTITIDRPRLARLLPRPVDDETLANAIDMAGGQMRAWLMLAAFGGLRCAEIATLDRAGLTDTQMRIVGKGGHERIVPIHPEVRAALKNTKLASTGPVFRRRDGQPYTPKEISRRASWYFEALGHEGVTLHQARHSFGTRTYHHSKNLRAVQELMGHADPATTAGYAALDTDAAAQVIDALPALGREKGPPPGRGGPHDSSI